MENTAYRILSFLLDEGDETISFISTQLGINLDDAEEVIKKLEKENKILRVSDDAVVLTDKGRSSAYQVKVRAALVEAGQLNFDELRKKTGIPPSNLLAAVTTMEMGEDIIFNPNTFKYSIRGERRTA